MVLVIIGVVSGMAVTTGLSVLVNARQSATIQRMNAIDQALKSYRIAYDRIPCPGDLTLAPSAANYGVEAANQWSCTGGTPAANNSVNNTAGTAVAVAEGAVPFVTLGLSGDYMYDGWGQKLRYAVDASLTKTGMFTNTPAGALCGPITVNDANGNARSSSAIYALISHGPNGHGGYTRNGTLFNAGSTNASEQTNCHCSASAVAGTYSATYVQAALAQTAGTPLATFDDVVTFKERWQMQVPWDATGSACPAVWVADSGNNRVQKFDLNGDYLAQFGASGTGNGKFSTMKGISGDSSGYLYVADSGNNRVQKFDSSGNWQATFGGGATCTGCASTSSCSCSSGSGIGYLNAPQAANVNSSGNVWIADQGNSRLQRFKSTGAWLQITGGGLTCTSCISTSSCACYAGSGISGMFGNGVFGSLKSMALDAYDNVWASDGTANVIQKFDPYGNFLFQIGSSGTGNSQFSTPQGIAVDAANNVLVVDPGNSRVQKFDPYGNYLSQFGTTGTGNGQFATPYGIALDASGNIWVADTGNNRIEKFDPAGNFLGKFGSSGSSNAQFSNAYWLAISR
jgi:type II secretory pathway pseudopilin PulG